MQVVGICLRHFEAKVRNQIFFTNFTFVCSEEGFTTKGKTYPVIVSLVIANTMVKILVLYLNSLVSYNQF